MGSPPASAAGAAGEHPQRPCCPRGLAGLEGWFWASGLLTHTHCGVVLQHSPSGVGGGAAAASQEGQSPPWGVTSASVLMAATCPWAAKTVLGQQKLGWGRRLLWVWCPPVQRARPESRFPFFHLSEDIPHPLLTTTERTVPSSAEGICGGVSPPCFPLSPQPVRQCWAQSIPTLPGEQGWL